MRTALIALSLALLAGPNVGAVEKRAHPRLREYRRKLYGARAIGGSAAAAGIGTLRNVPREWGGGAVGFGKRFGSYLGEHAVKETIEMGVAALRHEDLRYHPSNLHGTWPRMEYAIKSTFIVPRTNRPGKTVALGRISGSIGSGLISRIWQPASTAGLGAGFASGGISLGAEVGFNVAREFWPRKHVQARRTAERPRAHLAAQR
jgi:hypothetical protein